MNETFLNSMEEVVGHLFLGGTIFSVSAYAIFLCYAAYDYQNEKPAEEKSPIDLLVKDFMHSEFWLIINFSPDFFIKVSTQNVIFHVTIHVTNHTFG